MSEAWLKYFSGPPGLRELVVEYETIGRKRAQLDAIVERNKKWKLRLQDRSGHLSAENTQVKEWKWMGRSDLDGQHWVHHGDQPTMEYVVLVDRWVFVEEEMDNKAKDKSITDWGLYGEEFSDNVDDDGDSEDETDEEDDEQDAEEDEENEGSEVAQLDGGNASQLNGSTNGTGVEEEVQAASGGNGPVQDHHHEPSGDTIFGGF